MAYLREVPVAIQTMKQTSQKLNLLPMAEHCITYKNDLSTLF